MVDKSKFKSEYLYIISYGDNDSFYSVKCINSQNETVFLAKDVSTVKNRVQDFCSFLNRNCVSPVHFYDVFEEYFY